MYESRLELDRLLLADFDPKLEDIREQPFQVTICLPDGTKARHIPDFFISRYGTPPTLVNVKPPEWAEDHGLVRRFSALSQLCAEQGWAYETWTGAPKPCTANLRWLAAFRRRSVIPAGDDELREVRELVLPGSTIGGVEQLARLTGVSEPRALVGHLIWIGQLRVNLDVVLSKESEVWK
jgi:hypothetical protein